MAPLLRFFLLALGLSWLAWVPFAASKTGLIPVALPAELTWLGEYGPALAALILTWRDEGRVAAGNLFARLGRWRVGPWWYLAAIGLTPLVVLLVLGVMALAGGARSPIRPSWVAGPVGSRPVPLPSPPRWA